MIEILDFLKSIIGLSITTWGLSVMAGAGIRLGWDWMGCRTKKAPNHEHVFVRSVQPDE